jgi:phage tail sheath protein FI
MVDTVMRDALVDSDMVNYRYFVDTFAGGIQANSKSYISELMQLRQISMAILNPPSQTAFNASINPRFTDSPTAADPLPQFKVKYINDGGNIGEEPEFLYTLPAEQQGASWAAFYFPYIKILDNDTTKLIPPAALVSNAFVRKFTNGNPFKVVANRRGILTSEQFAVSGIEYRLTDGDRGELEAKGINPIIQRKDGTVMVYGNQSGFQTFRSVLNSIHVRDFLITVQTNIEDILRDYVFEFNDDALRLEVSSLIRNYLSNIQNSYSVLTAFDVVFDRSNNPPELVSENASIIDVVLEPTGASSRYINRITLTRGGQPAIGGFTAF